MALETECSELRLSRTKVFNNLANLGVMETDKDTVAEGRVLLGTVAIKHLQALVWWVRDNQKRGVALVAANFTPAVMQQAMIAKGIEKGRGAADTTIKDLGKFDPEDYDVHEDAFLNLLAQTIGSCRESIRYVVRADQAPAEFVDEREERMFQLPLNGNGYEEDNRAVYRLLKAFLISSAGWAWIEQFNPTENGRAAFQAWSNHYNGQGELSKRTAIAKARIEQLHYKNEQSLSFEKYTERLTKAFTTLGKDREEALTGRKQVEHLLKGIKTSDTELIASKAIMANRHCENFAEACAYFGAEVARVHPAAQLETQRWKKRHISELTTGRGDGRGRGKGGSRGRYGGRGDVRDGGRGRGGGNHRTVINGVDVSNPTRSFTEQEWDSLGYDGGRAYVVQARERMNNRGGGRGRDGGRGRYGQRAVGSAQSGEQQSETEQVGSTESTGGRGRSERGAQNGRGFGRNAYGRN